MKDQPKVVCFIHRKEDCEVCKAVKQIHDQGIRALTQWMAKN